MDFDIALPRQLQDFILADRKRLLAGNGPSPSKSQKSAVERNSVILSAMDILVNSYGYGRRGSTGRTNRLSIEAAAGLVSNLFTAELEMLGVNGVVCGDDKIQKMWRANRVPPAN